VDFSLRISEKALSFRDAGGASSASGEGRERGIVFAWGSAQPFEKARNEQENPRKSKSLPWKDFARLGPVLLDFEKFGIGLEERQ
jgi:hypothetical protein